MASERTIFSISEERTGGTSLISSKDLPRVRLEVSEEEGARNYSVTGFTQLDRLAASAIIEAPFQNEAVSWQEVRRGLRAVSIPSRQIRSLSRSSVYAAQLYGVQASTKELSDILSNNQDYWVKSANIPVFNYSEAQQYATDVLYEQTSEKKVLRLLEETGLDSRRADKLRAIITSATQSQGGVEQLEAITGMDLSLRTTAQIEAILSDIDSRYVTELIHRLQYRLFVGFPEKAHFDDGVLAGGSDEPSVLIREKDVPIALPLDYATVAFDAPRVDVSIGRELRDKDRKTGLDRRRVTFYTQTERQVALPRLAWRTSDDGARSFRFPISDFERSRGGLARPSSLLGAALIAQTIGLEAGIDYDLALRRRVGHKLHRLGRAGLWPLVAVYRQEAIFENSYFEAVEKALQ